MKGSIRNRGTESKPNYQYLFSIKNIEGKYHQCTKSGFKTRKAAESALAEALVSYQNFRNNSKNETLLKDVAAEYLNNAKFFSAESTYTTYNYRYNKYLKPMLYDKKIVDIDSKLVQKVLINSTSINKGKALSPKSLKGIYSLLHSILDLAIKDNIISRNPCEEIPKIKVPKKLHLVFSKRDINRMLDLLNPIFFNDLMVSLIIRILLETGLRRGELLGLTWNDIDFETGSIFINKHITYNEGKTNLVFGAKSNSGVRVIPMHNTLHSIFTMLKNINEVYKEQYRGNYIENFFNKKKYNFIFRHENGKLIHPIWIWREVKKLIYALDLNPELTLHDFRHTFASNFLVKSNANIMELSYLLGHASVAFTFEEYCHFIDTDRRTSIIALSTYFDTELEAAVTKLSSPPQFQKKIITRIRN